MFGDFSRFENDPEIGLNGIYLSQGSPILDSDWNEQVAALTEWITVVGRLAAGDVTNEQLRRIGFDTEVKDGQIEVSPGMALIAGRVIQTSHQHFTRSNPVRFLAPTVKPGVCNVCLVMQDSSRPPSKHSPAYRNFTDWRLAVVPEDELYETAKSGVRSYGDGQLYTPRLKIVVDKSNAKRVKSTVLEESTVALVEFHGKDKEKNLFKLAASPGNTVCGKQIVVSPDKKSLSFSVSALPCGILSASECYLEYLDEEVEYGVTIGLLKSYENPAIEDYVVGKPVKWPLPLVKAKVSVAEERIVLSDVGSSFTQLEKHSGFGKEHYRLRVWSFIQEDTPSGTLVNGDVMTNGSLPFPGFRVSYSLMKGQVLIPGDRWYLPMRDGCPVWSDSEQNISLAGSRVFRAIASLKAVNATKIGDGSWTFTAVAELKSGNVEAPIASTGCRDDDYIVKDRKVSNLQPVSHRLDDSLHRLTGALNAARSLTRQTPCKELKTRVSYLPLRRWLASAYVHEIADLGLEGFLAKVRRSIDVAPEDEHRFREQAALVLEEANQLAGSLPQPTKSQPAHNPNTIATVQPPGEIPTLLGDSRRNYLDQIFIQESPRS